MTPEASALQATRSWEQAGTVVVPGAAEAPSADQGVLASQATDNSGENGHVTATPQPVTLQDGTVIWQLKRERSGSTPAREH